MIRMREIFYVLIALGVILPSAIAFQVYAQTTITVDNTDRREYTYCPLSDTDVKSLDAEIDGCPLVRIYVNGWNKLTPSEQEQTDTFLRARGFVDSGEHVIK